MSYLIDTDILIYSLKGNSTVTSNFMKHKSIPKSISVVSFGELVFGACKSQHPERNLATIRHLAELFPVIEISRSIMETFGEYKASLQKKRCCSCRHGSSYGCDRIKSEHDTGDKQR